MSFFLAEVDYGDMMPTLGVCVQVTLPGIRIWAREGEEGKSGAPAEAVALSRGPAESALCCCPWRRGFSWRGRQRSVLCSPASARRPGSHLLQAPTCTPAGCCSSSHRSLILHSP